MTLYDQMEEIIARIRLHQERLGGQEKLWVYLDKVYKFLNEIPAGKVYTVSRLAEAENVELFVDVVCLYSCEKGGVSFLRGDMGQFRRLIF